MQGKIFQLNIARNGGVPKTRVTDAMLTTNGLIGDAQAHPQTHGGAERALCLYSRERIEGLQGEGHPISPGSVGENVTIEGVDWNKIVPGVRLELGDVVVIEISKYTFPCRTIVRSFIGGEFKRISQDVYPGDARVYARVICGGNLCVGQSVRVIPRESD